MTPKFKVEFLEDAVEFISNLEDKARKKIVYNIDKASYVNDPKLFKKLKGTEIWEFRTKYNRIQYRVLAFWDNRTETLVVCTHGIIKKSNEINKK